MDKSIVTFFNPDSGKLEYLNPDIAIKRGIELNTVNHILWEFTHQNGVNPKDEYKSLFDGPHGEKYKNIVDKIFGEFVVMKDELPKKIKNISKLLSILSDSVKLNGREQDGVKADLKDVLETIKTTIAEKTIPQNITDLDEIIQLLDQIFGYDPDQVSEKLKYLARNLIFIQNLSEKSKKLPYGKYKFHKLFNSDNFDPSKIKIPENIGERKVFFKKLSAYLQENYSNNSLEDKTKKLFKYLKDNKDKIKEFLEKENESKKKIVLNYLDQDFDKIEFQNLKMLLVFLPTSLSGNSDK